MDNRTAGMGIKLGGVGWVGVVVVPTPYHLVEGRFTICEGVLQRWQVLVTGVEEA